MRLAHLLATAAVLCALFVACYPAATCVSSCGVTFTGSDCAGFSRLESNTVAAFGACDAGSPDDVCSQLSGWTVRVLPESQTQARDDAGDREWTAPPNDEGLDFAYGDTNCWGLPRPDGGLDGRPTILLADEHWTSGVAATELVHAVKRQCFGGPDSYSKEKWVQPGFACVVSTAERAPMVLTGSEGGTP